MILPRSNNLAAWLILILWYSIRIRLTGSRDRDEGILRIHPAAAGGDRMACWRIGTHRL